MELLRSDDRMIYRVVAVAGLSAAAVAAQVAQVPPAQQYGLDGALVIAIGFLAKVWLDERKKTDAERERNAKKDEQILAMTENTSKTLALATATMERVEALFCEDRTKRR